MRQPLTPPIQSNIVYDSIDIENIIYSPETKSYQANVYGVMQNNVMPLVLVTTTGLQRINSYSISDDEIDTYLQAHSEQTGRVQAALSIALERLYGMVIH